MAAISPHIIQNCSTPANCSNGIVTTAAPQPRSDATLTGRRPIRSMTGPPTSAASTTGSRVQNATIPALAALPVLCSTNHGTPMPVRQFPVIETTLAIRTAVRGRRLQSRDSSDTAVVSHKGEAPTADEADQQISRWAKRSGQRLARTAKRTAQMRHSQAAPPTLRRDDHPALPRIVASGPGSPQRRSAR